MVRWALSGGATQLFDPAVGLGAFIRAARNEHGELALSGMEIDPLVLEHFSAEQNDRSIMVGLADYLESWGLKHQAIVCNPPYLRFQEFLNREGARSRFEEHLGVRLSGYTNAASAFLLKSLSELMEGGRLAYIMPLEFLNAGYGTTVKQRLLDSGSLRAIVRIESEQDVFPDAITSVGIILASREPSRAPVAFFSLEHLHGLDGVLTSSPVSRVALEDLRPQDKWLKYFDRNAVAVKTENLVPLREYGHFSRGIATGANEFFVLRPSEAAELRLPTSALRRCMPRSSFVTSCTFGPEDYDRLIGADAPVLLFDVRDSADDSARRYIRTGEQKGYHERYLTKMRKPWYRTEAREPAPIWFGVFSRGVFKAIRNYTDTVNLTCYHGFHPNLFGSSYVDRLFLYLQSTAARSILGLSMRRYGKGLDKFEPNDLNHALVPSATWLDALLLDDVDRALDACRRSGELPEWADQLFDSLVCVSGEPVESLSAVGE